MVLLHYGFGLEFERSWEALAVVLAASAVGGGVYLALTYALGLEEPRVLVRRVRSGLRRS
jgi:hypothetical protein